MVRWHHSPRAVAYALDVLTRLAKRYRDRAALFGIEVLNEPIDWLTYATSSSSRQAKDSFEARRSGPIPMVFLKRFYRESYRRLRPILAENQAIVFHDGFRLGRWRDWFVREGMRGVMLDTHIYLVAAEQFSLFRLIPDRWLMGWYRLFVRWNECCIRRAARYTPVIVGEWCVANNLVNRTPSARNAVYREVAAMQRKAWSASAGQIYWSYQLRGNRAFLPTIDPQSDTSRLDPWDLTHVWHAGWMAWGAQGMFGDAKLPSSGKMATLTESLRRQTASSWQVDAAE